MINNQTEITDPDNLKEEPKRFTFDYSYWSHDGFRELPNGYMEPDDPKYADQKVVFEDLGRGVLDNAWKGFNCSLFAYGQTGAGKSYSMVGYGANKGIVPISCEQLFSAIEQKRKGAKKGEEYQVSFSMMEIYNEQVRDLLNPSSLNIKGGLKVRQHPNKGFYVEQLKTVPVNSYAEIDSKMEEGTKNRTVASTQMNATSSRAHTIVSINFTQKELNDLEESMTKTAIINLVDLAGSERAESTGATGDRLKEGSAINQSLSTLGNCIKALADLSQGKKGTLVPFRDSVLTKLLKNALGGNSKTVMIAALSPADINYEETLSTLRFADRAKAIKTKAVVNESPTDKLIRELKEENARLLDALKKGGAGPLDGSVPAVGSANDEEVEQMKKIIEQNKEDMEKMKKTWEQQLQERESGYKAELKAKEEQNEKKKRTPHMWNLNEDPSLSGMILHFVEPGIKTVGSTKADPKPDIVLGGLGIQEKHATIENKKNKVIFRPCKGAKVLHNGNAIVDEKELHHNDRLLFGSNTLFVFHHPQDAEAYGKATKKPEPVPTYDSAQKEIAENSGLNKLTGTGQSKEDLLLQEDLVQIWPMIAEANAMSEELDKKCKFEIALISPQAMGKKTGRTEVCVKMKNLQSNNEFLWDRNKFINRKFLMTEMYQNHINGDQTDIPEESDPFWEDPSTEVLIGTVHIYLQSICHLIDISETLNISDFKGVEKGCLQVEVWPCDKKGNELEDDSFVESPSELVGQDVNFKIKINRGRGLPASICSSFCKYKMYLDEKYTSTEEIKGTINPDFNHERVFSFAPATKQFVKYLQNEPLVVEVWGRQKAMNQSTQLNTRELMMREKTLLGPGSVKSLNDLPNEEQRQLVVAELQYKMAVEASTYRRRMERSEEKLKKVQALMEEAKRTGSNTVSLDDLEKVMRSGNRLRAVAMMITKTKKAEKKSGGRVTSEACILQ